MKLQDTKALFYFTWGSVSVHVEWLYRGPGVINGRKAPRTYSARVYVGNDIIQVYLSAAQPNRTSSKRLIESAQQDLATKK